MHVLIVDDNQINRVLPAAILKKEGHVVAEAASGEQALSWLAENRPDCVLLDISMPGMSGEEVCRRIRGELAASLAGLRVIAYTAHAMPEERERIMNAGFDDLLIKPISRAALLAAVAAVV